MEDSVRVTKTVRVHDDSGDRYVRVIGDGTPENTRLLDTNGAPIPETVLRVEITVAAGQCARGVFTYYLDRNPDGSRTLTEETDQFEAWVILEPPPPPTSSESVTLEALYEAHAALAAAEKTITDQAERIAAASFALGSVPSSSAACDVRVPGPSTDELLDIAPERMPGPAHVTTHLDPDTGKLEIVEVELIPDEASSTPEIQRRPLSGDGTVPERYESD